tara:strand:- start:111 stop:329 length:219 start_codon:yes stop_codon:yes gene_type:complete
MGIELKTGDVLSFEVNSSLEGNKEITITLLDISSNRYAVGMWKVYDMKENKVKYYTSAYLREKIKKQNESRI